MSNHFRIGDRVILSPAARDPRYPTDHWRNIGREGTVVETSLTACVSIRFDGVDRNYIYRADKIALVNSSRVVISSLDYITSDEITQEDKDIIKEYLDGC